MSIYYIYVHLHLYMLATALGLSPNDAAQLMENFESQQTAAERRATQRASMMLAQAHTVRHF